eukprot:NODE_92_length_21543_cov_0.719036.p16 type:complete len:127 gc:universal NODE_92_length_21543_cov_0.719036:441-61(-)
MSLEMGFPWIYALPCLLPILPLPLILPCMLLKFSPNQHAQLEAVVRKHLKLIMGSTISMPNLLLRKTFQYPNILYNKLLAHYNWKCNIPYQNIRLKKESGKMAIHPFICTDSHPLIYKLIKPKNAY